MLVSTRTYHLLTGAGGEEAVDLDAIAEGLQRLSQLVTEFPKSRRWTSTPCGGPEGTPGGGDAMMTLQAGPGRGVRLSRQGMAAVRNQVSGFGVQPASWRLLGRFERV